MYSRFSSFLSICENLPLIVVYQLNFNMSILEFYIANLKLKKHIKHAGQEKKYLYTLHLSCLLNPYKKCPLSILSTQPYQFLSSNFTQKYPLDMFPCTYFSLLGRVDNLDVIPEIRLNKYLQL